MTPSARLPVLTLVTVLIFQATTLIFTADGISRYLMAPMLLILICSALALGITVERHRTSRPANR